MTDIVGDMNPYPLRSGKRDRVLIETTFTFGSSGAISATDADDPAITLTKANTGDYDLVFPKCPDARLFIQLESDTLIGHRIQKATLDPAAGTASILTLGESGGTIAATEPASGDKLHLLITAESRS